MSLVECTTLHSIQFCSLKEKIVIFTRIFFLELEPYSAEQYREILATLLGVFDLTN